MALLRSTTTPNTTTATSNIRGNNKGNGLTALYTDAKQTANLVTESHHNLHAPPWTSADGPELHALRRKMRIQKNRLVTWGLEWSDDDSKGSIDASVDGAGMAETVTSVLQTVKDVCEEAEGLSVSPSTSSVTARYEDLLRDLTNSIDILYDISRSRKSYQKGEHSLTGLGSLETQYRGRGALPMKNSKFFLAENYASAETLVAPSRASTERTMVAAELPPRLDPRDLTLPEEAPPPYDSVETVPSSRLVGYLRQAKGGRIPVLVEHAPFDPAYRETGVSPPLHGLEAFLQYHSRLNASSDPSTAGLLNCLGYFEDAKAPRFTLIYELPSTRFDPGILPRKPPVDPKPVSLLHTLQAASKTANVLDPRSAPAPPALEVRFHLAYSLVKAFSQLHDNDIIHREVNSSNIVLFSQRSPVNSWLGKTSQQNDFRQPYICSFDLFSEYSIEASASLARPNIYRHPQDNRIPGASGTSGKLDPRFALYSLGLVLLEIGMWFPLSDVFKAKYSLKDWKRRVDEIWVPKLAAKCGTAYMQCVKECLAAADHRPSDVEMPAPVHNVYSRVATRLRRCCFLDEEEPMHLCPLNHSGEDGSLERPQMHAHNRAHSEPQFHEMKPSSDVPDDATPARSIARRSMDSQMAAASTPTRKYSVRRLPHEINSFFNISISETREEEPGQEPVASPPRSPFAFGSPRQKSDGDNASLSSINSRYCKAANIIARAWRSHREKVTALKSNWHGRRESRVRANSKLTPDQHRHYAPPMTQDSGYNEPETFSIAGSRESTAVGSTLIHIDAQAPSPRPKLRVHHVDLPQSTIDEWHNVMLPRLEKLVNRALKESDESVSIDLVSVGETAALSRPTIFVTCTSTSRVKAILHRKFVFDEKKYDLKVRRGKIRRSKVTRSGRKRAPAHRSMVNDSAYASASNQDLSTEDGFDSGAERSMGRQSMDANPLRQQRPLCGASIGAFKNDRHLPPVSYGGVVLVDGEPFGMSVHHLLDDPSEDDYSDDSYSEYNNDDDERDAASTGTGAQQDSPIRSSASGSGSSRLDATLINSAMSKAFSSFEIDDSDEDDTLGGYESPLEDFDTDFDTDSEDDDDDKTSGTSGTQGDIAGIASGEGKDLIITQPALDDVDDAFFPSAADKNEDHYRSNRLGHVHASSGIRRLTRNGIIHEIDWALLKLDPERLQPYNLLQGGKRYRSLLPPTTDKTDSSGLSDNHNADLCPNLTDPICRGKFPPSQDEYPTRIAPSTNLGNTRVHCFGRTSGLAEGVIEKQMTSVRIYRRRSFSHSWRILGDFGMGGDSGAWVVGNGTGEVVGHVLAWCERNRVAYFCPMEVLVEDMLETLKVGRICLPGGEGDERESVGSKAVRRGGRGECVRGLLEGVGSLGVEEQDGGVPLLSRGRISPVVERRRMEVPVYSGGGGGRQLA